MKMSKKHVRNKLGAWREINYDQQTEDDGAYWRMRSVSVGKGWQ